MKRYLRCLSYCKNVSDDIFSHKFKSMDNLECSTYMLIKKTSHFLCSFGFESEEYSKLSKDIEIMLKKIDKSSDPDSKKAMEWARSGQLELPEK